MSSILTPIIMLIMVIPSSKLMCTIFLSCLIVSTFSVINAASASIGDKQIDLTSDIRNVGGVISLTSGEPESGLTATAASGAAAAAAGQQQQQGAGVVNNNVGGTFSVRCPPSHLIKPCDCVEIEKGLESEFNENESLALTNDSSSTDQVDGDNNNNGGGGVGEGEGVTGDEINVNNNGNSEPHPDIIETVVFCKHIYSRKQLMESMKPFKRHRINYLVIDSCSIPPFPTNIFNQINILWMEILNSTIQFRESFFECGANCL